MLAQPVESPCHSVCWKRWPGKIAFVLAVWPLALVHGENKPTEKDLVKAEAHLSVDRLPAGDKCQILIRLTVQPEWHIRANTPQNKEEENKTEIEFKGKLGSKLIEVKYPTGKKFTPKGEPTQLVYDGKVDIRGTLEIPANAAGSSEEVEIIVRYQACNETICRIPTTVKLAAKLPVAKQGEAVKQINEKLFATPPK